MKLTFLLNASADAKIFNEFKLIFFKNKKIDGHVTDVSMQLYILVLYHCLQLAL